MIPPIVSELGVWLGASTCAIFAAWLACRVLKRVSAAMRHAVWLAAFIALLALPFARWRLPKQALIVARMPFANSPVPATSDNAERFLRIPVTSAKIEPADTFASAASTEIAPDPAPFHPAPVAPKQAPPLDLTWIALAAWILGSMACLAQVAVALRRLARLETRPASLPMAQEVQRWSATLGLRFWRLRINRQDTPQVAMTWGVRRPTVLLPRESDTWEAQRLEAVMLHELAHVRRRDSAIQLMAAVVCALYWFNPLVWLGARAMRKEAENAADDVVLGSGVKASAYARELLQMAAELGSKSQPLTVAGVTLMKHSKIESRVVAILDSRRRRRAAGSLEVLGALGLAMALALPFAVVMPTVAHVSPQNLADSQHFSDGQDDLLIASTQEKPTIKSDPAIIVLDDAPQTPDDPKLKAIMSANEALKKKLRSRVTTAFKDYSMLEGWVMRSLDAPTPATMHDQRALNARLHTLWSWYGQPKLATSGRISLAAANAWIESIRSMPPSPSVRGITITSDHSPVVIQPDLKSNTVEVVKGVAPSSLNIAISRAITNPTVTTQTITLSNAQVSDIVGQLNTTTTTTSTTTHPEVKVLQMAGNTTTTSTVGAVSPTKIQATVVSKPQETPAVTMQPTTVIAQAPENLAITLQPADKNRQLKVEVENFLQKEQVNRAIAKTLRESMDKLKVVDRSGASTLEIKRAMDTLDRVERSLAHQGKASQKKALESVLRTLAKIQRDLDSMSHS